MALTRLPIRVYGEPKPQPRIKAYLKGVKAGIYTPGNANGWKAAVAREALNLADGAQFEEGKPLDLLVFFYLPRPKSHYNKSGLKSTAPAYHTTKPDVDNLLKSTVDALVDSGVIPDDKTIMSITTTKQYAWNDNDMGAMITIREKP